MTKVKRFFKSLLLFGLILLVLWAGFFSAPTKKYTVSADTSSKAMFEQTNVMDDLKKSTIDGEAFDLTKYSFNSKKNMQVISFVEYCYSFNPQKQDNFGLYVYLYNPKGEKIDTFSPLNMIQFAVGLGNSNSYYKYRLAYLNTSIEADYEGLFYKFRVELPDDKKEMILETVNSTERVYHVSGIEILTSGELNATEYMVSTTYKYSGYAKGYGNNENAESTLRCSSEQADSLMLDVHPTQYRPEGTNMTSRYTQDILHSVYFAVPNRYIETYGEMSAVHAIWKNAVTAPILVTGNENVYDQVSQYMGDYIYGGKVESSKNSNLDYALIATKAQVGYRDTVEASWGGYVAYNVIMDQGGIDATTYYDEIVYYLRYLYYANTGDADNFVVSSQNVLNTLSNSALIYGGELVNGKYSKCMFSSVDDNFTEVNIKSDESFSLTSNKISQTWWENFWGLDGSVSEITTFDGIQAIYPVKEADLAGSNAEIGKRLYIDETDVHGFKQYFNAFKTSHTVYLFRYMQSEYVSHEVTEYKHTTDWALIGGNFNTYEVVDTNAYFAKMSVQLDFDIIDVTFSNGEADTVIPVVSNPIDVVPDVTPPVITMPDEEEEPSWLDTLKKVLLLLVGVVLLIVFWPIIKILLTSIVKFIAWIIRKIGELLSLPFRKRKRNEKEENKKSNGKNE